MRVAVLVSPWLKPARRDRLTGIETQQEASEMPDIGVSSRAAPYCFINSQVWYRRARIGNRGGTSRNAAFTKLNPVLAKAFAT